MMGPHSLHDVSGCVADRALGEGISEEELLQDTRLARLDIDLPLELILTSLIFNVGQLESKSAFEFLLLVQILEVPVLLVI